MDQQHVQDCVAPGFPPRLLALLREKAARDGDELAKADAHAALQWIERAAPYAALNRHNDFEIAAYTMPVPAPGQDPLRIERVTRRGGAAQWAVRWMGNALAQDGSFEFEPSPSNRDADFLARCRFGNAELALAAARAAVAAGVCDE
ncbi:hypothetical protein [uncultured Variovorax sp.]|uniref:hypothetical protein n=1 Tax=uncultured Variovorax sp. TaxID=114708 RepID=UPI002615887C|nr:hypothetical protein [uncultured Variovorax sp.]